MELLKLRKITKRNSFADLTGLFFALAVIFGAAIFFLILYNAYNEHIKDNLNEALTASTDVDPDSNVTKMLDEAGEGISRFNPLFPLLIIGVFGFVLVSALMFRSHPAFLFIGLIVLAVALILAAIYSNVYTRIAEDDEFTNTDTEFNIIGLFLDNLPIVIMLLFVAIAIILYALSGRTPGGQI